MVPRLISPQSTRTGRVNEEEECDNSRHIALAVSPRKDRDTASGTDSDTASENVTVRRIVTTRRQSPPAALPPLHFRHSAFIDQFSDCGCAYFPFTFQGSSSASYVSLSEL